MDYNHFFSEKTEYNLPVSVYHCTHTELKCSSGSKADFHIPEPRDCN